MPDSVMVRPSALVRLLTWARAVSVVTAPEEFRAGPAYGSDIAASPKVSPIDEMSAYTLAWVYVCVQTCASDLASLPWYVERNGEAVWDHDFIELMQRPRMRASGVLYARQRCADWYLSGNAYDLVLREPTYGVPVSLQRLHPGQVKPLLASNGDVRAWEFSSGGAAVYYSADDVIHYGDIGYEMGPVSVLGVSRIRALMRDLSVDVKALELSAQSASRGAPAFIVRPASDDDRWDQEQTATIAKSINKMLASVAGGALVLGGRSEVTPLGFTARDMEYSAQREQTRQAVLSAFRVTPTIVGLPGANYATADKEAEGYWTARKADAAVFESALSPLAEALGKPGDRARIDFSGVAALRADTDARLDRAMKLWTMGLTPRAALDAVGLSDIEWTEPAKPAPAPAAKPADVDGSRSFESVLAPEPTEPKRWTIPTDEEGRASLWRSLEDDLRGPQERRMARNMALFLRAQAERIGARSAIMLPGERAERAYVDEATMRLILDSDAELQALYEVAGPDIQAAIDRSVAVMSERLGAQLSEAEVAQVARQAVEGSLQYVHGTSMDAVSSIVRDGIEQGQSPTVIADRIRRAAAFTPARALMVARTEVTRAVNAGGLATIDQAQANGAGVAEVEWLSSRDGHVRSAHEALDAKRVAVGGEFEFGGAKARGPGQFGSAALDANCRCTVLPVLEE